MEWSEISNPERERRKLVKAMKANRCDALVSYQLAKVYAYWKNFDKAAWYGRKAVKLQPDNTELNEFMAFVCGKKGDIYLAAKYWEILVKLDPEDGYYWTEWEKILNEIGNPAQ